MQRLHNRNFTLKSYKASKEIKLTEIIKSNRYLKPRAPLKFVYIAYHILLSYFNIKMY